MLILSAAPPLYPPGAAAGPCPQFDGAGRTARRRTLRPVIINIATAVHDTTGSAGGGRSFGVGQRGGSFSAQRNVTPNSVKLDRCSVQVKLDRLLSADELGVT